MQIFLQTEIPFSKLTKCLLIDIKRSIEEICLKKRNLREAQKHMVKSVKYGKQICSEQWIERKQFEYVSNKLYLFNLHIIR